MHNSGVFIRVRFASRARARISSKGFTLIELLVALTVLAILTVVAVPSFNDALLSNRLASFANSFNASAQLARSEAIKRNATVLLCRSANGTSCATSGTWQQGWIVFHDANNNGVVDSGETILQVQQAISSDYHFTTTTTSTSTPYALAFSAIGGTATTATLLLCRATPSPGKQERTISISATGRTAVATTRTGTCT